MGGGVQSSELFPGCQTPRNKWAAADLAAGPACSRAGVSTAANGPWTSCGAAWTPAPCQDSHRGCWWRGAPALGRPLCALRWYGPPRRQGWQSSWHHAAWPSTSARGRTRGVRCCGGLSWAWWNSWGLHLSSLLGTKRSSTAHLYPLLWSLSPVKDTLMTPSRGLYQIFPNLYFKNWGGLSWFLIFLDVTATCWIWGGLLFERERERKVNEW